MKNRRLTIFAFVAGVVLMGLLTTGPPAARGSQITICQSCTTAPGGDPNLITNTGAFNVVSQGSRRTLQNPLLIIVGVYNNMSSPMVSFTGCAIPASCPAASLTTYGLTSDTATFTSASSGSAFAQLGLSAGGSENFGNWSAADVAHGFAAPTLFTLFAFALNTKLTSTPITIDEFGAANGSFIIAYSCKDGTGSATGCAKNGDRAQTVFTNTGLIDNTGHAPEASAVTLTALVLLAFGALVFLACRRELA
jgi:hypothetical protein